MEMLWTLNSFIQEKEKEMNSRNKGKKGELEIVHVLKDLGFAEVRRGQQFSGANGDADVVGIKGIHIEVKRRERTDIHNWLCQAIQDAREGELPVVFHRRNHEEWKASCRLCDFTELIKAKEELEVLQRKFEELQRKVSVNDQG